MSGYSTETAPTERSSPQMVGVIYDLGPLALKNPTDQERVSDFIREILPVFSFHGPESNQRLQKQGTVSIALFDKYLLGFSVELIRKILVSEKLIQLSYTKPDEVKDLSISEALMVLGDLHASFWMFYKASLNNNSHHAGTPKDFRLFDFKSLIKDPISYFLESTPQPDSDKQILSRDRHLELFFTRLKEIREGRYENNAIAQKASSYDPFYEKYRKSFSEKTIGVISTYFLTKITVEETSLDLIIFFQHFPEMLNETLYLPLLPERHPFMSDYNNILFNLTWLEVALIHNKNDLARSLLRHLETDQTLSLDDAPQTAGLPSLSLKDFYRNHYAFGTTEAGVNHYFSTLLLALLYATLESESIIKELMAAGFSLSPIEVEALQRSNHVYFSDFLGSVLEPAVKNQCGDLISDSEHTEDLDPAQSLEKINELTTLSEKFDEDIVTVLETSKNLEEEIKKLDSRLKNQPEKSKSQKEALEKKFRKTQGELPREIAALRESIHQIQTQIDQAASTLRELNAQHSENNTTLHSLRKTLVAARTTQENKEQFLRQKLTSLNEETEALKKNISREVATLKTQIASEEKALKAVLVEQKRYQDEISQLSIDLLAEQQKNSLLEEQRHQLTRPKQLTIPIKTISIPPSHLEVTERYWAFFNEIATEIKAALQGYYEPDEYALTLKGSRANERPKKKHGRGLEPYSLSEKTDLDVALFYKSKDSVIPPHILIQSHIRGKTNIREQSSWGLLVVITLKKCKLKIDLCCLPIESIPSDELSSGPSVSPKPEASSSPASTSNTAEDEGETSLTGSADLSPELLHTIEKHIETAPVPTLAQYFIPPKSDDFESPGLLIRTENQKELIFNISEYLQASPADAVLPRYTKAIAFLFWVHLRNDSYKPHRGVLPVDLKVLNLICQLISRPEYPQLKSGAIFFIQLYYKRDAQKVHDFVEKYGLLRNLLLTPEPKDTVKPRVKTSAPPLPPKATIYLQNWSASVPHAEKESLVRCLQSAEVATHFIPEPTA